jgi:hypothetical protein
LTEEDIEKIRLRVEGAFKPLRCVAEVWDYKKQLRFKVFDDNGNGVVEMPDAVLSHLIDESNLQYLLEEVRGLIQRKGFILCTKTGALKSCGFSAAEIRCISRA